MSGRPADVLQRSALELKSFHRCTTLPIEKIVNRGTAGKSTSHPDHPQRRLLKGFFPKGHSEYDVLRHLHRLQESFLKDETNTA
jgi:hypothetical protein